MSQTRLSTLRDKSTNIFSNAGNIGIGITNPSHTLHVNGSFSHLPAGVIISYVGINPPSGFLICDGSAISRTTYNSLFNVIGILYGSGDSSTTFNLPDMRSRIPVGANNVSGLSGRSTSRTIGATGGFETASINTNQMPIHTHNIQINGNHFHSISTNDSGSHQHGWKGYRNVGGGSSNQARSRGEIGGDDYDNYPATNNDLGITTGTSGNNAIGNHSHSYTTSTNGNHQHTINSEGNNNNAHENMPPFLVMNFIIKT